MIKYQPYKAGSDEEYESDTFAVSASDFAQTFDSINLCYYDTKFKLSAISSITEGYEEGTNQFGFSLFEFEMTEGGQFYFGLSQT